MSRRASLLLFALALGIRLAHLAALRTLVWFEVPLVDGANYVHLARSIAAGHLLGGREAFWQPPLYPYVLAALLAITGSRMALIYVVQAAIGALTCVVTARLGARLWGRGAGLAAGCVMALYGPLVHFDVQPLIPVLHVALCVAGLALLVRAAEEPGGGGRFGAAGAAWGLAGIATPNVLLAAPAGAVWAAGRRGRRAAVWFLLGVGVPVLVVAARNLLVAGEPVLISSNGGINFYIGNNPDYDRTVRLRPGGEFEQLAREPEDLGVVGAAAQSRWFAARGLAFLARYPGAALRLYLRKARDLIAGREIPRNESLYDYREVSPVLAVLLWRRLLSFPFGLVAALALAGAFLALREGPGRAGAVLLLLYAGSYAFSILLFFPTGRYRLPIVPVLALFAGRLLASAGALRRAPVAALLAAGLVLFNLDARTPTERYPEEAALNAAYALRVRGRPEEARAEYRRALALNPRRIDAPHALAAMAAADGDWEEAVRRDRQVLENAPDFADVRRGLAEALLALGRRDEARAQLLTAIHLAPGQGPALADLALMALEDGTLETAYDYAARGVAARPDLPETQFALGMTARALRRRNVALRALAEAVRLFPEGSPGGRRAREILDRMQNRSRLR